MALTRRDFLRQCGFLGITALGSGVVSACSSDGAGLGPAGGASGSGGAGGTGGVAGSGGSPSPDAGAGALDAGAKDAGLVDDSSTGNDAAGGRDGSVDSGTSHDGGAPEGQTADAGPSGDSGQSADSGEPEGGDAGAKDASTGDVPPPDSDTSKKLFQHAVASGDPLPDAVILWTRITTDATLDVKVRWQIATDTVFTKIVATGETTTNGDRDHTVKVDVTGLSPATTYYYRFIALDGSSPIGRTRTAPQGGVSRLRFAVVSCASYAHGYFHAYRSIAKRLDIDAVLHLGDYIYEYGSGQYGAARPYEPASEILSLQDYRTRHGYYRKDPDLQAIHRQHPFIAVWDDHEVADDSWSDGAANHTEAAEGAWSDRKAAAQRAYNEWMPIREPDAPKKIYRTIKYGDLAELIMLDTRSWGREKQVVFKTDPATSDPNRQLLGADQEAWLKEKLTTSTSKWKLIGQQVMMGQLDAVFIPDSWDGYPTARQRFFDILKNNKVNDAVVLTGDIHSSWAINLTPDPNDTSVYDRNTGQGALAVEFVTPAVSSPGLGLPLEALLLTTPHIKHVNLSLRGYTVLDVTPERVQSAWYVYDTPEQPMVTESFAAAFATYAGQNRLTRETAAASPPANPPPAAPA
ncbi:MAG TPA: alkaline phosphatase D family protein [Polyangiaceae bacterium]|nr:alkaline phosphatase D family protein [Polyangiaceae bacterium]